MTLVTGCIQNITTKPLVNPTPLATLTPMIILTPVDNVDGNNNDSVCYFTCNKFSGNCECLPNFSPVVFEIGTRNNLNGGNGSIDMNNQAGSDAVVVLTDIGKKDPLISIFIKNRHSDSFDGIKDGSYDLYYILGNSFNRNSKKFASITMYKRFKVPFVFPNGLTNFYIVKLSGNVSDDAEISNVAENNFPMINTTKILDFQGE
jgi:hypothetical protein